MNLAVVADPALRERMRCIRIIADQTSMSALGAASWHELDQLLTDAPNVGLVFYAHPLDGAPEDAIEQLLARTKRLVLAVDESHEVTAAAGLVRTTHPIAEETLVVMARAQSRPSTPPHVNFAPVDFLQMICMSGGSHVLVLSREGGDAGIIEVRDGEVWTAFDALGVGEDAFARLIRPEMRARVSSALGSRKERTIFKGLQELVFESLRRIDEGLVTQPPPMSATQLEVTLSSPEQLADRIRQLNEEARRSMMTRNYDDAARALVSLSELDPTSHLVRANLSQLRKLGYPK
ncbi:MAG TPA: DUF4388 domain-containing protein [Polyangiaceae bacterium]|jgi:hypothetical protein|nr:DUF4388 domain-containing protein [Polyangiaceae bacterium]